MNNGKLLSLFLSVALAFLMLSSSIAVPLLCRPFYYAHIGPMDLTRHGLTREEIVTAYGEMMDYCLGLTEEFSAGALAFSESGASHFADVRALFLLDLRVLAAAAVLLAAAFLLCRAKGIRPYRFGGRGCGFWAACGLGAGFLAVGGLAALDFDRAFTVFHALFFPGKTNWIFSAKDDPIILYLPQEFFRNCALLILGVLLLWCAALIIADLRGRKSRK